MPYVKGAKTKNGKPRTIKGTVLYVVVNALKEEKTTPELISGIGCDPNHIIRDFLEVQKAYGKTDGRRSLHFIQSFDEDDCRDGKITAEQAHALGIEFATKQFAGYQVAVATHTDQDNFHNHFIVNSVSYENGRKFQQSISDYRKMQDYGKELGVQEYGLTLLQKGKRKSKTKVTHANQNAYNLISKAYDENGKHIKGVSYKIDCLEAVRKAKLYAFNREDFISLMNKQGYDVLWTDTRKYITFTDSDGNVTSSKWLDKHASQNIHGRGYSKADFEADFENNGLSFKVSPKYQETRKEFMMSLGADEHNISTTAAAAPTQDVDKSRADRKPIRPRAVQDVVKEINAQKWEITRLQILQNKYVSALKKFEIIQNWLAELEKETEKMVEQFRARTDPSPPKPLTAEYGEYRFISTESKDILYAITAEKDDELVVRSYWLGATSSHQIISLAKFREALENGEYRPITRDERERFDFLVFGIKPESAEKAPEKPPVPERVSAPPPAQKEPPVREKQRETQPEPTYNNLNAEQQRELEWLQGVTWRELTQKEKNRRNELLRIECGEQRDERER